MAILYKTLLFALFVSFVGFTQTPIEDAYAKIQKKLSADKKYLNVFAVNYSPTSEDIRHLSNIPKSENSSNFSFRSKDGVTYQILFLKDNLELDSLTLLTVKEIEDKAANSETFFGSAATGNTIDTIMALSFGDLQDLYFESNKAYTFLFKKTVEILRRDESSTLLGISLGEKSNRSRGLTSLDNTDFLNYFRTNGFHRYPGLPIEAAKRVSSRRRSAEAVDSNKTDFQIDASFSHISFFHNEMDFGFSSISAEISFGARDLNQVPWKSMIMNLGVRSLIVVPTGATQNLRRDLLLDVKLMGRMRLNTFNIANKLPFLFGEKSLLNVGSGLILDVSGTRNFGLPFFNLYIATGSSNFSNPYSKIGPDSLSTAFFSFKQWEASWSFYWNSSEDKTVRYRMDIGAANYDVHQATYSKSQNSNMLVYNKIKPFVTLSINFAPQNVDYLGISTKFYDNVLNLSFWLRLMEFSNQHTIRVETSYFSSPILRNPYAWENQGGNSMVQIRYRYGLK